MITAETEAPGADTSKEVDSVFEVLSYYGSIFCAFVLLIFAIQGITRRTSV
jgi:hypothetical protein